ncbi:phage tail protein [Pseudomonas kurunegalensis]|uniref:phage tail protein n=1 Tax=Pseudomonas kurunegalensis TaxID=485880 RepID=UPI002570F65B|nr:phage tail protein [Pseudomonas kurunegalensis]WJD60887.1 phage tail protein [Pseudomonas kurunegalensis]
MSDYYCILTPEGRNKLARAALLNQPLLIDRMAVGDGNPLETPPEDDQVNLVHEVYRAPLNKLYTPEEDNSVVIAEMAIPTTAGGWQVNEISLIDAEGIVIAIGNYPMTWKPPFTSGTGRVLLIRIMLDVTNATDIVLIIDPAAVMATEQHVRLVVDDLREYVDQTTGVQAGIYTKVEVNVRGQVIAGWNPDTLAGYGIVNAYTKSEIDLLLSQKANNAITLGGYGIGDAYTKVQVDGFLATKQPNLGYTPVQQGGGAYQDSVTKVYLGWSTDHLRAQAGSQDLGRIWTETNRPKNTAAFGNPAWWRCADTGTVRQRGVAPIMTNIMEQRVTFPAAFAENPVVTLGGMTSTADVNPSTENKTEIQASIVALDNTGFTLASRRLGGSDTDYVTVMWQAEGRA